MTKMVREAIEALKDLPEERQETLARAILDYASHDDDLYHLTDEERREVRAGLAEIRAGDIATHEEVADVYKRIGLPDYPVTSAAFLRRTAAISR